MEAEKRLKRAYDEGGFPLWARAAMWEVEVDSGKGGKSLTAEGDG